MKVKFLRNNKTKKKYNPISNDRSIENQIRHNHRSAVNKDGIGRDSGVKPIHDADRHISKSPREQNAGELIRPITNIAGSSGIDCRLLIWSDSAS